MVAAHPAGFEQQPRRIEIDAHAKLEIRLSLAADNRSQMEDGRRSSVDHAFQHAALGDIADLDAHPAIVKPTRRNHVQQHKLGQRLRLAMRVFQCAARQQFTREPLAEKTRTASDQYFHDACCP